MTWTTFFFPSATTGWKFANFSFVRKLVIEKQIYNIFYKKKKYIYIYSRQIETIGYKFFKVAYLSKKKYIAVTKQERSYVGLKTFAHVKLIFEKHHKTLHPLINIINSKRADSKKKVNVLL